MDNRLTVCRAAHFRPIVSWMVLLAPLLALFRAKPANESARGFDRFERVVRFFEFSEEIRWGGEKFTSRVANRVKIGQRERWREREGRKKKKEKNPSPLYIIIDPRPRVQRTRLELNYRFSVDDHKKCRAVESISVA